MGSVIIPRSIHLQKIGMKRIFTGVDSSAVGAQVLLGAYLRYDEYLREKHGKA